MSSEKKQKTDMGTFKPLPAGSFPTMITPFRDDGTIDYPCLRSLVEWYISSGCAGLFACCLSSEMYNMTPEERLEVAGFVAKHSRGRVPVVASGTFEGDVEEQARFVNRMAPIVDAVVVLPCQLATADEPDALLKSRMEKLLSLTQCPLGLYECPVPYKRVMSPELLVWAAESKRFLFHKDTCCDTAQIKRKIEAVREAVPSSPFRFYNANVETLKYSNDLGGSGFSGISANFYPYLHAKLCQSPCPLSEEAQLKIQRFLSIAELTVCVNYPASSKVFLNQYPSFSIGSHCRNGCSATFNEVERLHLRHLKETAEHLAKELHIEVVAPKDIAV